MEVLGHFVFEIVKILLLSYIYTLIIVLVFYFLSKLKSGNWFDRVYTHKKDLKRVSRAVFSGGLFLFMFTHWGNHGLGDISRIPLAYGKEVIEINGTISSIPGTNNHRSDINIHNFEITDEFICGEAIGDSLDYAGKYFVYSLKTNDVKFFKEQIQYTTYAQLNGLPDPGNFESFSKHYSRYWNTWRIFLIA